MNYLEDDFSWFDSPEFKNNQIALAERTKLFKNALAENKSDPFAIENVFDSSKALPEQELGAIPNLTGNDQFKNMALENPIPADVFGDQTAKAPASNFLGTQGEGQAGAIADFGMDAVKSLSSGTPNEASGVGNTINMTMKGAQAGMAVAGPWGAAVGGGVGLVTGAVDAISDLGDNNRDIRAANKKAKELDKTKREQEWRQKDGLDSLSKLTSLRKEQDKFII